MTPIMHNVLSVSSAPLLPDGYVDHAEITYLIAVLGKVLPECAERRRRYSPQPDAAPLPLRLSPL
jgi:hypothetical protein